MPGKVDVEQEVVFPLEHRQLEDKTLEAMPDTIGAGYQHIIHLDVEILGRRGKTLVGNFLHVGYLFNCRDTLTEEVAGKDVELLLTGDALL